MKMRIASTVLFCLLFAAFAYASPRPQDEPKSKEATPAVDRQEKPETKPETQEQEPDEMKSEKNDQQKQENKDAKEQEKENKDREKQEQKEDKKSGKEMGNMRGANEAHARPAGKSGHIPDDKFRSNFGRGHTFHVSRPVIVNNQPTFNYGGYSFIMVDPWPVGWAYTDDCYIDYIDGEYFLFDLLHPGVRVALFVSM
ncbi:MAG: hypothetical protein WA213_05600 [Terriglobales bacterium]